MAVILFREKWVNCLKVLIISKLHFICELGTYTYLVAHSEEWNGFGSHEFSKRNSEPLSDKIFFPFADILKQQETKNSIVFQKSGLNSTTKCWRAAVDEVPVCHVCGVNH